MDRMRELEVFVEIASAGSLAEAGRRLNVSPPAVTRILAGLEERLGVRLVQRTTRKLKLTSAGLRFWEMANRLIADMDAAEREVTGSSAIPQGRVAVTASTSFGRLVVSKIFAQFLEANPRVRGSLFLWDRNVNLIEEGVDVAVRIGELPDTGLIARRVGEVRQVLVASPKYLERAGTPQNVDDLSTHRIIAFRGIMQSDHIKLKGVTRSVSPWIEVNDALSALSLVENGYGITLAMSYLIKDLLSDGKLIELFPNQATPKRPVHLVWPDARLPTPAVRAFVDFARPQISTLLN